VILALALGVNFPAHADWPTDSHVNVALCTAMIVARLIDPASKLATARGLDDETASTSLGQVLDLGEVDERELYATLDWLVGQQARIEKALAR